MTDLNIKLVQSLNDKNTYKYIRLQNTIDCLLISSEQANKSACSLSVDVGYIEDPDDVPGMAHYLEHMLFLGTKKYPGENEYGEFISNNSGQRNAYTSTNETNFHFEISHKAYEEALDRFSQFFKEPLFTESCAEREINAVSQENDGYKAIDPWRKLHLLKMTGKAGHKFSRFGVGSKDTLSLPNIRERVIQFYKEHYSANRMKLVVVSNRTIEELQQLVVEKFSDIPNYDKPLLEYKDLPYDKENCGNLTYFTPLNDGHDLEFRWVLDYQEKNYRQEPTSYWSHIIGHEGENSLLSMLKAEGLATGLEAGAQHECRLFTVFFVGIHLTNKGYQNYKDVIQFVFKYLQIMRQKGVQEWIFKEIKACNSFTFRYKESVQPLRYAISLATRMHYIKYEDVIAKSYLMEEYQPENLQKVIDSLGLENCRLQLNSKLLEDQCNLLEKIYNIKYSIQPLEEWAFNEFKDPQIIPSQNLKKLDIPVPNNFIPTDFTVYAKEEDKVKNVIPERILQTDMSDIWFKPDHKFLVPKVVIRCDIFSIDWGLPHSAEAYDLAKIWIRLLTDHHLKETMYLAEMAAMGFVMDIRPFVNAVTMSFTGYHHKMPEFVNSIITKITQFDPRNYASQLKDVIEKFEIDINNILVQPPFQRSIREAYLLTHNANSNEIKELLKLTPLITIDDVFEFGSKFLSKIRLEWLFSGNIQKETVLKVIDSSEQSLKGFRNIKPISHDMLPLDRITRIEPNQHWIHRHFIPESDPSQENSSVMIYIQYGPQNDNGRLFSHMIHNFFGDKFYNQMRVQEQLGYYLFCIPACTRGIHGIIYLIQSSQKSPEHVSSRIFDFHQNMKKKVNEMTDEEFEQLLQVIVVENEKKDERLTKEADRMWDYLNQHHYEFDRKQKDLERVKSLKKSDIIDFANKYLFDSPSIFEHHIIGNKFKEENDKKIEERRKECPKLKEVDSIQEFKSKSSMYPDYYMFVKK